MKKVNIKNCPFCGSKELLYCVQNCQGSIYGMKNQERGIPLYHMVCRDCGSVVHSYVKDPELLVREIDRRD